MREIAVVFDPERKLFLYFGVIFLAVGVGPFGTYEAMTFSQRAMFWSLDVLGGMAIIVPILHVFYPSRLVRFIPSYPRFLLGVAIGAVPAAGFITILYGTVGAALEISTPYPLLVVQVTIFSAVLLLTELVLWPAVFGRADMPEARSAPPGAAPEPPPILEAAKTIRLLSRLPKELQEGEIISISMQDHYAEVTTTKGSALILIRLSDAMDLLDGWPGARIHRSHWVSRAFSQGIRKSGRRMEVTLTDQRALPLSATYLEAAQMELGLEVCEFKT